MAAHVARDRVSKTRQRIELLAQHTRIRTKRARDGGTTSGVLDQLGSEWQHIDDIRWPGKSFANVDHVLVGPAGVFVIDTRKWSKGFDPAADTGRQDDASLQTVTDGLVAAAHAVGSLLGLTHRRAIPMLCFVGGPESDSSVGTVLVCSTTDVVTRLESMPHTFDAGQVRDLAEQLRRRLLPATGQLGAFPQQRAR